MTRSLHVWMNGELVGAWQLDRDSHTFRYEATWLESPHSRSLSLSMPISSSLEIKGEAVKNYFDNLLPDSHHIRKRLAKRFKAGTDIFGLLEAIGRDCVGAVQLLPDDATPDGWNRIACETLSDEEIERHLQAVPSDMRFAQDDELFRISIAGAQEKTAFLRYQNQWCRPHGATPTTHIFKLPLGIIGGTRLDMSDSVENEWLCAQIIAAMGLPVATTSMATFGEQKALVVERFDRAWMEEGRWIARLPQEDFCQALGISPDQKYEADGGPGMQQCLRLLQRSSQASDTLFFILTQLLFFFLRATDGHAKNYSLFSGRNDIYQMTPLYDVLSVWPYLDKPKQLDSHKAGLAMALRSKNPHYRFKEIQTRHWHDLAMKNGGPAIWAAMQVFANRVDAALAHVETLLPPDFPVMTWDAISKGTRLEAARFLANAAGIGK